ncbi:hypothetical protein BESB_051850 [Besnoitia besnoiti]|uniref:Uncharacterized protein n=1 Tax=Besnoitia besnoiti TaxID=94643 RepID=A0A2A9MEB0_BESBE|nr:hypothetical protein BESB_051850 [Besnoitia besnoiti]PFH35534.1 hypothetical protein BESB_051850 [Besnoitia besnoiti]
MFEFFRSRVSPSSSPSSALSTRPSTAAVPADPGGEKDSSQGTRIPQSLSSPPPPYPLSASAFATSALASEVCSSSSGPSSASFGLPTAPSAPPLALPAPSLATPPPLPTAATDPPFSPSLLPSAASPLSACDEQLLLHLHWKNQQLVRQEVEQRRASRRLLPRYAPRGQSAPQPDLGPSSPAGASPGLPFSWSLQSSESVSFGGSSASSSVPSPARHVHAGDGRSLQKAEGAPLRSQSVDGLPADSLPSTQARVGARDEHGVSWRTEQALPAVGLASSTSRLPSVSDWPSLPRLSRSEGHWRSVSSPAEVSAASKPPVPPGRPSCRWVSSSARSASADLAASAALASSSSSVSGSRSRVVYVHPNVPGASPDVYVVAAGQPRPNVQRSSSSEVVVPSQSVVVRACGGPPPPANFPPTSFSLSYSQKDSAPRSGLSHPSPRQTANQSQPAPPSAGRPSPGCSPQSPSQASPSCGPAAGAYPAPPTISSHSGSSLSAAVSTPDRRQLPACGLLTPVSPSFAPAHSLQGPARATLPLNADTEGARARAHEGSWSDGAKPLSVSAEFAPSPVRGFAFVGPPWPRRPQQLWGPASSSPPPHRPDGTLVHPSLSSSASPFALSPESLRLHAPVDVQSAPFDGADDAAPGLLLSDLQLARPASPRPASPVSSWQISSAASRLPPVQVSSSSCGTPQRCEQAESPEGDQITGAVFCPAYLGVDTPRGQREQRGVLAGSIGEGEAGRLVTEGRGEHPGSRSEARLSLRVARRPEAAVPPSSQRSRSALEASLSASSSTLAASAAASASPSVPSAVRSLSSASTRAPRGENQTGAPAAARELSAAGSAQSGAPSAPASPAGAQGREIRRGLSSSSLQRHLSASLAFVSPQRRGSAASPEAAPSSAKQGVATSAQREGRGEAEGKAGRRERAASDVAHEVRTIVRGDAEKADARRALLGRSGGPGLVSPKRPQKEETTRVPRTASAFSVGSRTTRAGHAVASAAFRAASRVVSRPLARVLSPRRKRGAEAADDEGGREKKPHWAGVETGPGKHSPQKDSAGAGVATPRSFLAASRRGSARFASSLLSASAAASLLAKAGTPEAARFGGLRLEPRRTGRKRECGRRHEEVASDKAAQLAKEGATGSLRVSEASPRSLAARGSAATFQELEDGGRDAGPRDEAAAPANSHAEYLGRREAEERLKAFAAFEGEFCTHEEEENGTEERSAREGSARERRAKGDREKIAAAAEDDAPSAKEEERFEQGRLSGVHGRNPEEEEGEELAEEEAEGDPSAAEDGAEDLRATEEEANANDRREELERGDATEPEETENTEEDELASIAGKHDEEETEAEFPEDRRGSHSDRSQENGNEAESRGSAAQADCGEDFIRSEEEGRAEARRGDLGVVSGEAVAAEDEAQKRSGSDGVALGVAGFHESAADGVRLAETIEVQGLEARRFQGDASEEGESCRRSCDPGCAAGDSQQEGSDPPRESLAREQPLLCLDFSATANATMSFASSPPRSASPPPTSRASSSRAPSSVRASPPFSSARSSPARRGSPLRREDDAEESVFVRWRKNFADAHEELRVYQRTLESLSPPVEGADSAPQRRSPCSPHSPATHSAARPTSGRQPAAVAPNSADEEPFEGRRGASGAHRPSLSLSDLSAEIVDEALEAAGAADAAEAEPSSGRPVESFSPLFAGDTSMPRSPTDAPPSPAPATLSASLEPAPPPSLAASSLPCSSPSASSAALPSPLAASGSRAACSASSSSLSASLASSSSVLASSASAASSASSSAAASGAPRPVGVLWGPPAVGGALGDCKAGEEPQAPASLGCAAGPTAPQEPLAQMPAAGAASAPLPLAAAHAPTSFASPLASPASSSSTSPVFAGRKPREPAPSLLSNFFVARDRLEVAYSAPPEQLTLPVAPPPLPLAAPHASASLPRASSVSAFAGIAADAPGGAEGAPPAAGREGSTRERGAADSVPGEEAAGDHDEALRGEETDEEEAAEGGENGGARVYQDFASGRREDPAGVSLKEKALVADAQALPRPAPFSSPAFGCLPAHPPSAIERQLELVLKDEEAALRAYMPLLPASASPSASSAASSAASPSAAAAAAGALPLLFAQGLEGEEAAAAAAGEGSTRCSRLSEDDEAFEAALRETRQLSALQLRVRVWRGKYQSLKRLDSEKDRVIREQLAQLQQKDGICLELLEAGEAKLARARLEHAKQVEELAGQIRALERRLESETRAREEERAAADVQRKVEAEDFRQRSEQALLEKDAELARLRFTVAAGEGELQSERARAEEARARLTQAASEARQAREALALRVATLEEELVAARAELGRLCDARDAEQREAATLREREAELAEELRTLQETEEARAQREGALLDQVHRQEKQLEKQQQVLKDQETLLFEQQAELVELQRRLDESLAQRGGEAAADAGPRPERESPSSAAIPGEDEGAQQQKGVCLGEGESEQLIAKKNRKQESDGRVDKPASAVEVEEEAAERAAIRQQLEQAHADLLYAERVVAAFERRQRELEEELAQCREELRAHAELRRGEDESERAATVSRLVETDRREPTDAPEEGRELSLSLRIEEEYEAENKRLREEAKRHREEMKKARETESELTMQVQVLKGQKGDLEEATHAAERRAAHLLTLHQTLQKEFATLKEELELYRRARSSPGAERHARASAASSPTEKENAAELRRGRNALVRGLEASLRQTKDEGAEEREALAEAREQLRRSQEECRALAAKAETLAGANRALRTQVATLSCGASAAGCSASHVFASFASPAQSEEQTQQEAELRRIEEENRVLRDELHRTQSEAAKALAALEREVYDAALANLSLRDAGAKALVPRGAASASREQALAEGEPRRRRPRPRRASLPPLRSASALSPDACGWGAEGEAAASQFAFALDCEEDGSRRADVRENLELVQLKEALGSAAAKERIQHARIRSLEQQLKSQRDYYHRRLAAAAFGPRASAGVRDASAKSRRPPKASASAAPPSSASRASSSARERRAPRQVRALESEEVTPGRGCERRLQSAESARGRPQGAGEEGGFSGSPPPLREAECACSEDRELVGTLQARQHLFPLLYRDNPAVATLFAFWLLAQRLYFRRIAASASAGSLGPAAADAARDGEPLAPRLPEVPLERRLELLLAFLFPPPDPAAAAAVSPGGESRIGFEDFRRAIAAVGCAASERDAVGAWAVVANPPEPRAAAAQEGRIPNAGERLASSLEPDADVTAWTVSRVRMLQRAKQTDPTFLFLAYCALTQRLKLQKKEIAVLSSSNKALLNAAQEQQDILRQQRELDAEKRREEREMYERKLNLYLAEALKQQHKEHQRELALLRHQQAPTPPPPLPSPYSAWQSAVEGVEPRETGRLREVRERRAEAKAQMENLKSSFQDAFAPPSPHPSPTLPQPVSTSSAYAGLLRETNEALCHQLHLLKENVELRETLLRPGSEFKPNEHDRRRGDVPEADREGRGGGGEIADAYTREKTQRHPQAVLAMLDAQLDVLSRDVEGTVQARTGCTPKNQK